MFRERQENDSNIRKSFQARAQYEFDKREDSLKIQQQLTDEKLKQQRLLAIQQQQELMIKGASLILSNQQKELNHLALLKSDAELQREQSQRQGKERQLALIEKEKTLQDANLKLKNNELTLKNKEVQSKEKERNIFIAGAILFLMLGIILFLNNRYKQKAYTLLEKQKQETELQKHKAEYALAELKSTQKQLIQSEKMASLGELTAGIAHEIQNPLNFVNNFSEVNTELIDELKSELATLALYSLGEGKGNLQSANEIADDIKNNERKINEHGKRADSIVKGMLQHSRSTGNAKEPTDINVLADEYLRLAYHGLRAKDKSFNATLETEYDKNIGKIIIIPQDIGRVVLNLINNAFYAVSAKASASTDGGYIPTISVSTKKMNDRVEIRVADNGNGIPQNVVDKIFQPFFTTKPTGQGTGLGLSLSYDIVKAHGGELRVETKEGEGSNFIVELPNS